MRGIDRLSGRAKGLLTTLVVLALGIGVIATQATAHIERASYWPDPAADRSVNPPAGGKIPAARSLFTALRKKPAGKTRVVCRGKVPSTKRVKKARRKLKRARLRGATRRRIRVLKRRLRAAKRRYKRGVKRNASIRRLRAMIRRAYRSGYKYRPSERPRKLTRRQGKRLLKFNNRLLARCKYKSIQDAVNRSRNNDRVVIMPGTYTEPKSRARPTDDPKCKPYRILNDRGQFEGLSYKYHWECPNDQSLIAVLGRRPGSGSDPKVPLWERRGIPNLGPCIRCNLQMEGSGVGADDVVVENGIGQSQPDFPDAAVPCGKRCRHSPIKSAKDVGIRVDRADGFVLRNMTVQHATEHAIYSPETDGARFERFKTYYTDEYGLLTFVADHHLIQDCDSAGHGDAAIYPGSSAETGAETVEPRQRTSTEIRRCDMHHSAAGYSGTASNGVHVHDNKFYDNALGFTTDVFTAAGHPGFPQDSTTVENNDFFSNNFNPYAAGSDVVPTIPVPVGTGLWIAGGNNNKIRRNRFWNNWRRGAMVFTVPDAFVCGDQELAGGNHQKGCKEDGSSSTSYDNKVYANVMGRNRSGKRDPNGVDFWWDRFPNQQWHDPPTTTGNCWYDNIGKDGTEQSITSDPPAPLLPSNCDLSLGTSGPSEESELLNCFADFDDETPNVGPCDWFTTPQEPQ